MEETKNNEYIKTVEDLEPKEDEKPQINYEEEYNKLLEENKELKEREHKLLVENNRLFLKLTSDDKPEKSELENIISNFN